MSDLTQRITQLPLEERIRLEERLLAARKNGQANRIPRHTEDGPVHLSFTQERLWFLAQLEPDSVAYNEASILRMTGPLDISALERSLDALAARHDSLRVCFQEMDSVLMQVAKPLPPMHIPIVDLSTTSADEQMEAAWQTIDTFQSIIFDLTAPPMWRALLIRLRDDDHIFTLVTHHIISDGWSSSILRRELGHFYSAYAAGSEPDPLPDLPVSYADFSVWQREQLQGERLAGLVDYWRERLAGIEPLSLSADYSRPVQPSHRGALLEFQLHRELSLSLIALARVSGASLYMLLLTAFQILLHRHSGQDDIVVGSPIANRNRSELEGVYGFFANTLVLRADCGGNPTFRSLLAQVRKNALDAFQHQDLPFEKLVEELHPTRDLGRNPFVDVMFALQNVPQTNSELVGIDIQRMRRRTTTSKFDLSLFLSEYSGLIDGRLEYATDLFTPTSMQRLIGHYQMLLTGIVDDPDCLIDELPLLTTAEQQQILVDWNRTQTDYPSSKTIHQLFHEQASRTPDAIALLDGERRVTYRELETISNQIAHHLRHLGAEAGRPIAICMERSAAALATTLAVLKIGAAYFPLDAASPLYRLSGMLEEANPTFLITDNSQAFCEINDRVQILHFTEIESGLLNYPISLPTNTATSLDMAYLMYTSGSTGTPKGVGIPHQAVVSLVCNTDYLQLSPTDVVGHGSNPAFDASTFEIWGALLNGATLALMPNDTLLSAHRLSGFIQSAQISTLFLTTALFNQLIEEKAQIFQPLDTLLFGGERVSSRHVFDCLAAGGPKRLLHVYGPTETTTFATWHLVTHTEAETETIPIGLPLANKQAYILDRRLQLVPIGVPGELYVGGAGLALGYLNRPELTAERFVPHPFSDEPGERLYRTGDLARYREDGAIEFLGRVDRQIKIRGFRVEPGEIEAVLRKHPAVRDGVIGVLSDEVLGKKLVAWWIGVPGSDAGADDLRSFLRQHLPEYMIPAAFVSIEELPLNANGKVETRLLPAPEQEARSLASQSPQTPLERQLLAIWQQALGAKNIGVDDNFFDVGGHSLLAVRLMAGISLATGQELPVASLFYGPTIREQAILIEEKGWSPPWISLVPVQSSGSRPPLFLVPPAASTGLRFAHLARFLGQDQPIYGFDPGGLDERSELHATIEEMAAHFVSEMRQLQSTGPYLIGGMCFGGHVAYEMAQQLGDDVPVLLLLDAGQPANGPSWALPPRNVFYYWRRFLNYRQEGGNHWLAVRRNLHSRWKKLSRQLRHWADPDLQRMRKVYSMQLPAMRNYVARPTKTKLVLFQCDEPMVNTRQQGWHQLSRKLEVIHFPNTTHRSLLLEDENVERIADQLREVIDRWMNEHWQGWSA